MTVYSLTGRRDVNTSRVGRVDIRSQGDRVLHVSTLTVGQDKEVEIPGTGKKITGDVNRLGRRWVTSRHSTPTSSVLTYRYPGSDTGRQVLPLVPDVWSTVGDSSRKFRTPQDQGNCRRRSARR